MKRLITIFIMLLLIFTGCSSNEKSEAELKEEIKAELKAEMEAEAAAEENASEEETATAEESAVKEEPASIDLKDTEILKAFIMEKYPDAKDSLENLIYKYGDFDKDGAEDVVCYLDSNNLLENPVFLGQKDGALYEISSDIGWFQYTQEIEFDDEFIYRIATGGGSGVADKVKEIYVYNGKKIAFTDASISLEGHVSGPNYSSEYVGTTTFEKEGDYKNFTHKIVHTGDDPAIETYKYAYDPGTFKFLVEDLTDHGKRKDVFYPEYLTEGAKISDNFNIVSFESGDMGEETISYKITSDNFVSVTLRYNGGIWVTVNDAVFSKNVMVDMNGEEVEVDLNKSARYAVDLDTPAISDDIFNYLQANEENEITGDCFFGDIIYEVDPMDSLVKADIQEFIISDSDLEKIK